MKIAFDVDGVVLKSIDVILDRINLTTGKNLRAKDLEAWDLEPLGLAEDTLQDAIHHMYSQPRIDNYAGASEVLSRIHRATGNPLLFITGRSDPETARRQLKALPWNRTVPEMIVIGGDRDKRSFLEETDADFIVEDDPAFLQAYLDRGLGVGLMLRPWNSSTSISVTQKFRGWNDVETWFFQGLDTLKKD